MSRVITIEPMTEAAFAVFGDVMEATGAPDTIINQGLCGRFHDRATPDFAQGRAGISLFKAEPRQLPVLLDKKERHPDGSQVFIPMSMDGFLGNVAEDGAGKPARACAVQTMPGQPINCHKSTWHGVLTPLATPGLFAVEDRIGDDPNLEEHWFDTPVHGRTSHRTCRRGAGLRLKKGRDPLWPILQ